MNDFGILDLLGATSAPGPNRAHVTAQAMELSTRWAEPQREGLAPGMFAIERTGVNSFHPRAREAVLLLIWRLLDSRDPNDCVIAATAGPRFAGYGCDCIVAYMSDSNGVMMIRPHHRALLERHDISGAKFDLNNDGRI